MKQFTRTVGPGTGAGSGSDEVANVGAACSNDAIKRRDDALIALELLKPTNICAAGIDCSLCGDVIAFGLVCLLLRDGMLRQQDLPPIGGHAGKVGVGLHALQFGTRLAQLLIDFGRFDHGEQVAFVYVCADIEVPILQVAVGARVDGRIRECLDVAGEREVAGLDSLLRMDHSDRRNGRFVGCDGQPFFTGGTNVESVHDRQQKSNCNDDGESAKAARVLSRGLGVRTYLRVRERSSFPVVGNG